jgi:hypothetical protein
MDLPSNVKRIAFLADYVPRQCGIATFTADLREAIAAQFDPRSSIIAVTNPRDTIIFRSASRPEQDIHTGRRPIFESRECRCSLRANLEFSRPEGPPCWHCFEIFGCP